ncbi:MAG: phosphomannomutase/phosphoglucomutase [Ilumatobacter coccineus]|uniref:Phosphomannomutase/phosphoglucomutase n=1 Tax=Ilumatobacter coccineus TaxID=467094 RepID=A0A2G6K8P9_9ACTN|nr:MAG: phosphomannomutase/phosphoglucomutase [Ilumatobacter coccineus]
MNTLDQIVQAYDVRGTVPDQFNPEIAHALGVAFARFARAEAIIVGRDMRHSGESLAESFAAGVNEHGVDVIDIGLVSTDLMYFASGSLDLPGVMITASHNPARYNGMKLCLAGARPVGIDTGLAEIRALASTVLDGVGPAPADRRGQVRQQDVLDAFVDHVMSFVDPDQIRPMKVVVDTANGMGGLVVPAVFERLPQIELEVMYGELDGTFPNHPADPLQLANQADLRARVVTGGFDLGAAFDGDADRVFVVDEEGHGISGSTTTALLAAGVLRAHPGATILHNLICSRSVSEIVGENGGVAVRTRVGHSFIKDQMAKTAARFGGEHSAHYYFADNYRADSGLIALVLVLSELSRSGQKMSVFRKPFERYAASGEINTQVDDVAAILERISGHYGAADQDDLDGLTISFDDWWFNLRPSNTEPLLRLNLEAVTRDDCDRRVEEVLSLITADDYDEDNR